jgi:hypothetical protein
MASASSPLAHELTQDRLKELLEYDPDTGLFVWRVSCGTARRGDVAGGPHGSGYLRIRLGRGRYYAHRLAFLYMTGALPLAEVDHIDRDRANNAWGNLRSATRSENAANRTLQSNNASGHRGVYRHSQSLRWVAEGKISGRKVHLGVFDCLEEAARVADQWRAEKFGAFVPEQSAAGSI